MFLSCGRYQRNQLPGNTREFQTPSLPAPGAGRGVYRGRLRRWRRRIEKRGGTDRWPSHIFILYWPLLTPRHGWNPLSSCAPSAENSAFFFRRDRCKCSPLPLPPVRRYETTIHARWFPASFQFSAPRFPRIALSNVSIFRVDKWCGLEIMRIWILLGGGQGGGLRQCVLIHRSFHFRGKN